MCKGYREEKWGREGRMRNEKGRLRMADIIKVERTGLYMCNFVEDSEF